MNFCCFCLLCLVILPSIFGTNEGDFISYCSDHGNGRPMMTSISLKKQQTGILMAYNLVNFSLSTATTSFRRIACTWRLLFDDFISELDDLVPAPKTAGELVADVPTTTTTTTKKPRQRGFRMGIVDESLAVKLDFENVNFPETKFDQNDLVSDNVLQDDSEQRCQRNYITISYIDGHFNKQLLGRFCGHVAVPSFSGDSGRSVMIDVQIYDPPTTSFAIKFRTGKTAFDAHNKQCSPDYVACSNSGNQQLGASRCIPEAYRCDLLSDCPNSFDEQGCKSDKPPTERPDPMEIAVIEHEIVDSGCGSPRFQAGASGLISSLNFPRKYKNNLRCVWYIATDPGTKILLSFNKTFDLEQSDTVGDCPYDSLSLYPRGVAGLKFGQRICGKKAPSPRLIASSYLVLVFETDSTDVFPGFSLKWKAITPEDEAKLPSASRNRPPVPTPMPPNEDSCSTSEGLTILDREGFIMSPAYGASQTYPSGMMCRWLLRPRPANKNDYNLTRIEFRFMDFSIQPSPQCDRDFVMIKYLGHDDSKPQWVRFCNGANVPPFEDALAIETTSGAEIIFRSDAWLEERGFALSFRAVFADSKQKLRRPAVITADDEEPVAKICGLAPTSPAPAAPFLKSSSPFLIGGPSFVDNNTLPWMVNLSFLKEHRCAGTLISDRFLLTAANCFDGDFRQVKPWLATVTGSNMASQIEAIYLNNQYGKNGKDADIALVQLKTKVAMSDQGQVVPICLPSRDTRRLDRCYVIGWHESKSGRRDRLKQVHAPIVDNDKCRNRHLMYEALVTDTMMCAGYEIGAHQICYAMLDGGSPLACFVDQKWELHGVLSFGKGCAGSRAPDVYTRVMAFSDWMKRIIAKVSK